MYLSKGKIAISNAVAVILLLLSTPFIFLSVVGISMGISDLLGMTERIDDGEEFSFIIVYVAMIAIFGTIAILSIKRIRLAGTAKKFNSFFESDPDGTISLESIARLMGKSVYDTSELFTNLVKKGYLINCTLQNPDRPIIVLNNGAKTATERFNSICCPNCGGVNVIKRDFVERCCYCGTSLSEHQSECS